MTKIIDFKNPELHKAFSIKYPKYTCLHKQVIIDIEKRVVECESCGSIVDAFDFILHTASNENHWFYHANVLKDKVSQLREIKMRLEKDVKNLESKIKRRTPKNPAENE